MSDMGREIYFHSLKMAISKGKLETTERQMLAMLRQQYSLSDADHEKALQRLNLTVEAFEKLVNDAAEPRRPCICCLDAEADHVILDCGHLCLCQQCSTKFSDGKTCPECRQLIRKIQKVF